MSETDLVYGVLHDNLILLPTAFAVALAADYRTLESVRTYGDARAAAMTHLELPGTSEDELDAYADADLYDPSEYDGWPTNPATWALDNLPPQLEGLGAQEETLMGDPTLLINPVTEAQVVAEATGLGLTIRRDDELIRSLGHQGR